MEIGKTTTIIISGSAFLYLLVQSTKFFSSKFKKIHKLMTLKDSSRSSCHLCNTELLEELENKFVICKICEALVCSKKCSYFFSDLDIWECLECRKIRIIQQKTVEWLYGQMTKFSTPNFQMALEEDILNLKNKNRNKIIIYKVRELVEKCLTKILNGSDLDATPIGKISDKEEYLPNSSSINTDYVELKRFVNRICQEVINISDTFDFSDKSVPRASFDPQTYEELLATAVLNKITSEFLHKNKYGMNNHLIEEKFRESSDQEHNIYEKMHMDILKTHKILLPDLLTEFDDDLLSNDNGSWGENWSLKQYRNDGHKISMLIPTPKNEIKTKIGEKDIDEISDSSSKDESLYEFYENLKQNPLLDEMFQDILHSDYSVKNDKVLEDDYKKELESEKLFNDISEAFSSKENIDEIFEEILMTENVINKSEEIEQHEISNELNEDKISICSKDNSTKYKSPLFAQYLVPPIEPVKISEALKNSIQNEYEKGEIIPKTGECFIGLAPMSEDRINVETECNENTQPIPGSIAEREHLKWLKATPLANNPYSPEALNKRLSNSHEKFMDVHIDNNIRDPSNSFSDEQSKEDISKYKRDYYINKGSADAIKESNKICNENDEMNTLEISLTTSDDSLTRIYTPSSQKTTILLPSLQNKNNEKELRPIDDVNKLEDNIALPSVKKLTEFYASSRQDLDSNVRQNEPMNIPVGISKITSKNYEISGVPAKPIASITARTLPPKIKEDLRKSLNSNDDGMIIRHNERNASPDIQQGLARNSIAYFENFYR